MCGLFGFEGERPDRGRLALVARLASRRGPHAMGVAWEQAGLGVKVERMIAPDGIALARMLARVEDSPRIIGHYRLATSGDWREPGNNQPIQVAGVAVAHNGNIPEWRERAVGIPMSTECDSELIAHWISDPRKRLQHQLNQAMKRVRAPHAVLALRAGELASSHEALPLYFWHCPEGVYFCSLDPKAGPWYASPGERRRRD